MPKINSTFFYNNKLKIVGFFLVLLYVILCPCCMTMRSSSKETKAFFTTANLHYKDTIVAIDNVPMHYIETGNPTSPTLIFIHGSPGSWDAFKDYLKDSLLLKKFRMISVDRPGFGKSNFRKAETLGAQSHIIEELIQKIRNDKPIFLVGHSMGGPIIAKMASEKPNDYKGLIFLAGSVDPDAEEKENWRYIFTSKPGRYLVPGALLPSNDELWWLKDDLKKMKPHLKKIISDVIIIHGTEDNLVPYKNVAFMKREFVHAKSLEIIPIKGANHFIPWVHYDLIRNTLLRLQ